MGRFNALISGEVAAMIANPELSDRIGDAGLAGQHRLLLVILEGKISFSSESRLPKLERLSLRRCSARVILISKVGLW